MNEVTEPAIQTGLLTFFARIVKCSGSFCSNCGFLIEWWLTTIVNNFCCLALVVLQTQRPTVEHHIFVEELIYRSKNSPVSYYFKFSFPVKAGYFKKLWSPEFARSIIFYLRQASVRIWVRKDIEEIRLLTLHNFAKDSRWGGGRKNDDIFASKQVAQEKKREMGKCPTSKESAAEKESKSWSLSRISLTTEVDKNIIQSCESNQVLKVCW